MHLSKRLTGQAFTLMIQLKAQNKELSCFGQLRSHTSPTASQFVSFTIFRCILSIEMHYSVL